jgi:hypothetical protein
MLHETVGAGWQRSSRCETCSCVWVLTGRDAVRVRDEAGDVLEFAPGRWRSFIAAVKDGVLTAGS